MRRFLGMSMVIGLAAILMQGCISATLAPEYQAANLDPHKFVKKVDQFSIIVDASQSMGDPSKAERKMNISEAFLAKLDESIPEFGYAGELRVFGHGSCSQKGKTVTLNELSRFSKTDFENALSDYGCAKLICKEEDFKVFAGIHHPLAHCFTILCTQLVELYLVVWLVVLGKLLCNTEALVYAVADILYKWV